MWSLQGPVASFPLQWLNCVLPISRHSVHCVKRSIIATRVVEINSASVAIHKPISPRWNSVSSDQVCRRSLQGLEQRLTPLVVAPQGQEESVIPLTMHEIQVLWEAMDGFIQVVRQLVPPSNQRDDLLHEIKGFRDNLRRALTAEAGA